MLGRAYENLGLLQQAAQSYERMLANPHFKWNDYSAFPVAATQFLEQLRLAELYERIGNVDRARHWYARFAEDWKEADPGIPELAKARRRLEELRASQPGGQS